ncbi:hypothetical protein PIIN_09898 [Serendipita indica DSM 11827]|uniref:Uncharacterized protein n=1 Tax=Serendipita indica (strain DSM 11827) TaxID=1109443 RepID=G4TX59_SERID|nr:hypothetical protein PIIN_09898 [Serendipita indica DSM 11827]
MRVGFFALVFAASTLLASAAPFPLPPTHAQWVAHHNAEHTRNDGLAEHQLNRVEHHLDQADAARAKSVR